MANSVSDIILGRCGLVCSNCGAFKSGKCTGCHGEKPMFRCCPVRACVIEGAHETCADCTRYKDLKACRKLNSFISRIFGLIFRSNRIGSLEQIRQLGLDEFKSRRQADGTK